MKTKDEVLGVFIKWKKMMETQTGRRVKCLRTDNGGEYRNDPFAKFCENEGIVRHFTVRSTPQQNGVAERMNRTLLEKIRSMLSNAGLGKEFWAEVVTYACHLINRLPSTAIDGKTPLEKWYGKPATDYDSLHVFGSNAYYHVKESKLDPRAKKAFFMGITSGIKGYRLWCLETKKIVFSRDVTFDESPMLKKVNVVQSDDAPKQVEFEKIVFPATEEDVEQQPQEEGGADEMDNQTQEPPLQSESIAVSKPRRTVRKPARFADMVAYASQIDDIPATFKEAVRSSEKEKWRMAMKEEMHSLHKNQTWRLTTLPPGKKAIGCKWGFAKKEGISGQVDVREILDEGGVQIQKIRTNENPADMMTKVVAATKFQLCLDLVNIVKS